MANQNLIDIQRWMQAVITHPDGIEEGIRSSRARQQVSVDLSDIEQVISRSRALDSVDRLRIYGNAYFARLVECLESEYPALVHAIDEESFDGFAFSFLQQYPSTSYTLNQLGALFPQYLAESRPPREDENGPPDWADWMIDLARLERAYSEVFDGPGVENQTLLQGEDLQKIPPEQMGEIRLVPVPCLRLMQFQFPVHEYVSAYHAKTKPEWPAPRPTQLAITRREYVVRRYEMDLPQYHLLRVLSEGESLEESIARTVESGLLPETEAAGKLPIWFRDWTAAGLFLRVEASSAGRNLQS